MLSALQWAVTALFVGYPLLGIVRRQFSAPALVLWAAFWTTGALSLFLLLLMDNPHVADRNWTFALLAESALCPAWLLFSLVYAREVRWKEDFSPFRYGLLLLSFLPAAIAVYFPPQAFFYSPDFALEKVLFLEPLAVYFYLLIVFFLASALFNMEETVVSAPHGVMWKVKFAIVGAGTAVAAHILYFSQALIYRALDMNYVPAMTLCAGLGAVLLVYSELRRGAGGNIRVSRRVAYKSLVLLFGGLGLVVVGLAGEGMKLFGDSFNRYLFAAIAFGACVLIVLVILSENVRRRLRLFVQSSFYGEKYDYRLQWKQFTERLSGVKDESGLYATILSFFCETFGMVGGCLFLRAGQAPGYHPFMFHEMDESGHVFPEEAPLPAALAEKRRVIDLSEREDLLHADSGDFLISRRVRFAVPFGTGRALAGFILLGPPISSGENYDAEDFELMLALSRQAGMALTNLRLGDELAKAREMESLGKMAAFVLHDLKNQVYPLSLLLENAREFIDDPEFQEDMLDSLTGIVTRMKVLISQLTGFPASGQISRERVELSELVRETLEMVPKAEVSLSGGPAFVSGDREALKKVVLNLCLNAWEAGEGQPFEVRVDGGGEPRLTVTDFGGGIDADLLREGLFTPFRSTKKSGMGIGLYQSKQIMDAHGGRIDVESRPGAGASFHVVFPREDKGGAGDGA